MGLPVTRGSTAPVSGLSTTSPSSTQVGDLVIVFTGTSTTVSGIPTHTLQANFVEIRTQSVDDGVNDGRFSVAYFIATSAGAQAYQAYTASTGTSFTGCHVIQSGTYDVSSLPAANSNTLTTNGAPNPPSVTGLTGDFMVFACAMWLYSAATANTPTAMANYTLQQHLAGSGLNDVVWSKRDMTGLSGATEDPAAYTDNTAPTGSIAITFALKGAVASTNYTADVNETVTLSEAIGAVYNAVANTNESVSLSESVGATYAAIAGPSETVSLSESLGSLFTGTQALGETVNLSESMTGGLLLEANVAETVILSESVGVSRGAIVVLDETVTLSEAITTARAAIVGLVESLSLAESLAAQAASTVAIAETVTLSEGLGVVAGAIAALTEEVSLVESIGGAFGAVVGVNESLVFSEAINALAAFTTALNESLSLAESVGESHGGSNQDYIEALGETVTWLEALSVIASNDPTIVAAAYAYSNTIVATDTAEEIVATAIVNTIVVG